jgi:LytS/YehU family sensor histidine kinase
MLFYFTILIDFLGMGITLWLSFYLLGRGFPSRLTLYAVVTLLAVATFFLGAYLNDCLENTYATGQIAGCCNETE